MYNRKRLSFNQRACYLQNYMTHNNNNNNNNNDNNND